VGQYQPNPNTTLTVTRQGDKLMLQQGDQLLQLLLESETDFFTAEDRNTTIRFIKDEKGQVAFLTVVREGGEVGRARKIK
jgi:hypothetical protein